MSTLKANRYENTASANGGIDIDSSGRVLLGTSTARSAGDVTAQLQVEGTDYQTSSLNLISNAGAAAGNVSHISPSLSAWAYLRITGKTLYQSYSLARIFTIANSASLLNLI